MKPAPGPYEVVVVETEAGRNGEKWVMIRNEGGAIATVYPAKESEATARLLAAAPEMLEALKEAGGIMWFLADKIMKNRGADEWLEPENVGSLADTLCKAKAAIAKAEGVFASVTDKPAAVEQSIFDQAEVPGEANT